MATAHELKRGDLEPPITATLKGLPETGYPDGKPIDLTLATAITLVRKPSVGSVAIRFVGVFLAPRTSGRVSYAWVAGDTDVSGSYQGEWEITWPVGRPQTVPNNAVFLITIFDDLG